MSLSLSQLKALFRKSFPIKAGGPTDKARSAGAIASLDALAEVAFGTDKPVTAAGITDATAAGKAMLKAADAAAQLRLLDKIEIPETATHPAFSQAYGSGGILAWLLEVVGTQTKPPAKPAAPINGHADDSADIFYGTVQQVNAALGDYELFYPGSGGNVPATNGRADLVGTTLTIRGLTGNNPAGSVGMRRAANGNVPASDWLTNADAFTGSVVVTPPTTPDAPFPNYDPVTRVLTFTHALGTSELEYNRFGGAFTAYSPIQVDDSSHSAGEWKARVKAYVAGNRAASGTADSPAIQAKAVTNVLPVANAGSDLTITQPASAVQLIGSGTDADGTIVSQQWTQVTGPNTAVLATATLMNTTASGLVVGIYQFRLTVTDDKGGTKTDDVVVTVNAQLAPTITSLSPAGGYVGTSVTVTGTGFGASQGSSTVAVNGVQATTVLSWSDTSVTFVVPAGATTGKVSVTTTGGTAFSAANYSVTVSGPVNGTYQHLSATNSLGTGFPQSMVLDANSYPTFVQALLDPAVWKVGGGLGQGYPSQTADSIRGHLPEILAFKLSTVTATLIGVEAGINDLRNGATAQQAYAAVKRLCQAIITGGCIPFVYTTPINRYAGDANIDAAQAEFNNLIVNGIADLQAAFVVAIHTEPRLMTLSTDVQQDGLHWTPAARRDIVAPMGASGLNRWATGERNFVVYGSGAPAAPAAPTFVDYNDVTDIAQYATPFTPDKIEYTLDNGVTWITPGPSDNIIHVGDVAKPYGYVQSRVRALGGAPPSAPLKYPSFQAGIPRLPNSPGDPQPYAFIYPKQGVSALQDYRGANAGPKAVVSPALVLDAFGTGKPGWQYPAGGFMLDIFDIAGTREGTYIHTNQLASYDTKQILFEQGSDAASTPNAFTAYIEGRQLYVRKYRADGGYAQTVAPITTADGTPLVFGLIISDDPAQTPLQLTVNHVSPGVYSDPAGGGLGDFVNLPFYMGARQGGAFACVGLFRGLQNFKQYQSGSYAASWDAYAESLTSTAGGTSTGGGTGGGTGDVPASFYAAPQNIEDNSGKFTYTGAYQQVDYTDYSGGHTYYLSPGASGLATLDKPVQAAYLGFFEGTTTANAVAVLVQIRTYTAAGTATWINLGVVTNEAGGVRKLALPSATGYYEVRLSNDPAHPGSYGLCDQLQLLQS